MPDGPSTTEFVLHGAREVLTAEAVHFEQQILALEEAVVDNAGLAFDLAKTLVESACKTILKDRGHTYGSNWELPKLLKETLNKLRLVPEGYENDAEVSESLRRTVGGLQTTIQGLCELRNTQGFASHGKDAYSTQLDIVQARLAARAADAVVNFLFRAHHSYSSTGLSRRLVYRELNEFNEWIDEQNPPTRIFSLEYRPSEVLFNVDHAAYRDLLVSYKKEDQFNIEPESANKTTEE